MEHAAIALAIALAGSLALASADTASPASFLPRSLLGPALASSDRAPRAAHGDAPPALPSPLHAVLVSRVTYKGIVLPTKEVVEFWALPAVGLRADYTLALPGQQFKGSELFLLSGEYRGYVFTRIVEPKAAATCNVTKVDQQPELVYVAVLHALALVPSQIGGGWAWNKTTDVIRGNVVTDKYTLRDADTPRDPQYLALYYRKGSDQLVGGDFRVVAHQTPLDGEVIDGTIAVQTWELSAPQGAFVPDDSCLPAKPKPSPVSTGVIVGASVGGVALLGAVAGAAVFGVWKYRQTRAPGYNPLSVSMNA
eukprot:m51a1_g3808 hypothetical protein (309) ;mRNA; f:251691-252722